MKVLVTGGAGMIGSSLVKRLLAEEISVDVVDNLWRGSLANIGEQSMSLITFFNADLKDWQWCLEHIRDYDVVFHLADIVAGIDFVFNNESLVFADNLRINNNVFEACKRNQVPRVIYVGTACSYPQALQDNYQSGSIKETDLLPADPESAYGWSKLVGELELNFGARSGFFEANVVRLFNVYGPPCTVDPNVSQVIPSLCRKAALYPDVTYSVWGSGRQRRAFIFVSDVIEGLLSVLERPSAPTVHLGPAQSNSIKEIAETIVEISGKDIAIVYDDSMPEGDKDRKADLSIVNASIGWEPKVSIREGLEKTYSWIYEQIRNTV